MLFNLWHFSDPAAKMIRPLDLTEAKKISYVILQIELLSGNSLNHKSYLDPVLVLFTYFYTMYLHQVECWTFCSNVFANQHCNFLQKKKWLR